MANEGRDVLQSWAGLSFWLRSNAKGFYRILPSLTFPILRFPSCLSNTSNIYEQVNQTQITEVAFIIGRDTVAAEIPKVSHYLVNNKLSNPIVVEPTFL